MSSFRISKSSEPNHSNGNFLSQVEKVSLGQIFENLEVLNDASVGNNLTVLNDASVGNNLTVTNSLSAPVITSTTMTTATLAATTSVTAPSVVDITSVKYYGAVGDGVADDTLAIQTALDAVNVPTYFPPGSYIVSQTLTVSVPKKVYASRNSAFILAADPASGSPSPLFRSTGQEVILEGLEFAGATGVGTVCIEINGNSNRVRDCEVFTSSETALHMNQNECVVEGGWYKGAVRDIYCGFNRFSNVFRNIRKSGGGAVFILIDDGANHIVENVNGTITFENASTGNVLIGAVSVASADAGSSWTRIGSTGIWRNGIQVVTDQQPAVADATDAASVILRLNELLARLRTHGLIAT